MARKRKSGSPELYVHKVIFQARYRPHLAFYDFLYSAAKELEYPHWETDRLSVVLRDYHKHCSLSIGHRNFSYDQDLDNESAEAERITRALTHLPEALNIKGFTRLGYRRKYLVPVDFSFEELVSLLNLKFYARDIRKLKGIPETSDIMYQVNAEEDMYKFNIRIGPVRKEEVPTYIEFDRKHHIDPERPEEYDKIVAKYPDVAIFIDLDLYRADEKIPAEEGLPFVEHARKRVDQVATTYVAYLIKKGE